MLAHLQPQLLVETKKKTSEYEIFLLFQTKCKISSNGKYDIMAVCRSLSWVDQQFICIACRHFLIFLHLKIKYCVILNQFLTTAKHIIKIMYQVISQESIKKDYITVNTCVVHDDIHRVGDTTQSWS